MRRALPWFPMTPHDFERDTSHLTPEQAGVYTRLLHRLWIQEGWLPDDDAQLAHIAGMTAVIFKRRGRMVVEAFFMPHPFKGGSITQKRMAEELYRAGGRWGFIIQADGAVIRHEQQEPAAARVRKTPEKPAKNPKFSPEITPHVSSPVNELGLVESESESHTPSSVSPPAGETSPKQAAAARATQMPAGWKPSAAAMAFARDRGFDAEHLFEHFRDHHQSKGTKFIDWDAAYRTWVRNQRRYDPRNAPKPAQGGLPFGIIGVVGGKESARQGPANDPNDHWGIQSWCASLRETAGAVIEEKDGKQRTAYGDWYIDGVAKLVAEAAKLPASWRGDWTPLQRWLDAGFSKSDILTGVKEVASWRAYEPSGSLMRFDTTLRRGKGQRGAA